MSRFKQYAVPAEGQVEFHGDHTTVAYVILNLPGKEQALFTGVAKRNPADKHDAEVGSNLALGRALEAAGRYLSRQGNGLVKHHDDMRTRNLKRAEKNKEQAAQNLERAVSDSVFSYGTSSR